MYIFTSYLSFLIHSIDPYFHSEELPYAFLVTQISWGLSFPEIIYILHTSMEDI